ncbi:TadE/TadG family type IV pilus assembly protein [Bradyrhizobium sp. Ec3.3]|uniref:TadE/TadG family type IV pilus assembly protein n=1 Tax=Bradyrhizobium sp. Ec3.3 TaxID=189753 RepID=UPI001FDA1C19|nr:TadE family protein [Bradyrhizobium sp. Ec3.3]
MRRLDQRGTAALEFSLVALPWFLLMFAIFDLGRYAITMQSLRKLASAGARAMIIQCYSPAVTGLTPGTSPSSCTGTYLSAAQMQNAAPFLYAGGLTPTLSISSGVSALTVTASQPGFTMLTPVIWGTAFNGPSASTQVPF